MSFKLNIILNMLRKFIALLQGNKKIIIRHGLVSCICATTELATFTVLNYIFSDLLTFSYITAFILATSIGFILHSKYTFSNDHFRKRSGFIFIFQAISVLIIGYSIFSFFIIMGLNPVLAKACQLGLTFTINVTFGKKITFREKN